jgi:hypothetical protein
MSRINQIGVLGFTGIGPSDGSGYTDYYQANMIFAMATAPTGWVKQTTYNDYALRIVSGTPTIITTNSPFSTVYTPISSSGSVPSPVSSNITPSLAPITIGPTTLTYAQLPVHTHNIAQTQIGNGPNLSIPVSVIPTGGQYVSSGYPFMPLNGLIVANPPSIPASTTGHTHGSSTTVLTLGSFTGNSTSLSIQYIDNIIAQYQK